LNQRLILKSGSPRRNQILHSLGLDFDTTPARISENLLSGEACLDYLKRITLAKLEIPLCDPDSVYISSDTIVLLGNRIYFKPADKNDAFRILTELSGKTHEVIFGIGFCKGGEVFYDFDTTAVRFRNWEAREIQKYIDEHRPFDKAGSYGIQDKEGPVSDFVGSYSNVLGFPLRKFYTFFEIWQKFLSSD